MLAGFWRRNSQGFVGINLIRQNRLDMEVKNATVNWHPVKTSRAVEGRESRLRWSAEELYSEFWVGGQNKGSLNASLNCPRVPKSFLPWLPAANFSDTLTVVPIIHPCFPPPCIHIHSTDFIDDLPVPAPVLQLVRIIRLTSSTALFFAFPPLLVSNLSSLLNNTYIPSQYS